MARVAERARYGSVLPYWFDREDGGGLEHLKAVVASKGYLSVESNWCDTDGIYGSDESDLNRTVLYSHRWATPRITRQERLQNEYELAERRRRLERERQAEIEWSAPFRAVEPATPAPIEQRLPEPAPLPDLPAWCAALFDPES
jgi:hypothetical protein